MFREIVYEIERVVMGHSIRSIWLLLIVSAVICILVQCIRKVNRRWFTWLITAGTALTVIFYVYQNTMMGTAFLLHVLYAALLSITVYNLGLLEIPRYEYALLFSAMLISSFFHLQSWLSFWSLYFFGILALLVWLEGGYLKNQVFALWMSMVFSIGVYLIYDLLKRTYVEEVLYRIAWERGLNNIEKLFLWGLFFGGYAAAVSLVVWLFRKYAAGFIEDIKVMGRKNTYFGRELFVISMVILMISYAFSAFISVMGSAMAYRNEMTSAMVYGVEIVLLFVQAVYMFLIVKLARAQLAEEEYRREKQDLIFYSSSLEKNMKEMRGIKHDIKNLFFTMGEYVSRSDDEEMKAFFYEKITPFAGEEIKKNDLYMKLQEIQEEEFRAFLYYKVNQGISYGLEMTVEIEVEKQAEDKEMLTDIVRILGIFLDNAIEEAASTKEKKIALRVYATGKMESYTVANAVRESSIKKGITAGVTTKGLGRGNGLLIVQDIVEAYPDMVCNSYFKEGMFYQNISIYKE